MLQERSIPGFPPLPILSLPPYTPLSFKESLSSSGDTSSSPSQVVTSHKSEKFNSNIHKYDKAAHNLSKTGATLNTTERVLLYNEGIAASVEYHHSCRYQGLYCSKYQTDFRNIPQLNSKSRGAVYSQVISDSHISSGTEKKFHSSCNDTKTQMVRGGVVKLYVHIHVGC